MEGESRSSLSSSSDRSAPLVISEDRGGDDCEPVSGAAICTGGHPFVHEQQQTCHRFQTPFETVMSHM